MKRFVITTAVALLLAASSFAQTKPSQTAPASKRAITYDGVVTDMDGKPLAGTTVRAFEAIRVEPYTLVQLGQMVTKDDGKYSFASRSSGSPGAVIVAQKDGCALGCAELLPGRSNLGEIRLGVPAATGGTIVDEAGKGIADARVNLIMVTRTGRDSRTLFSRPDCEMVAVTTDADGRFEFRNTPAKARIAFILTAPGRASIFTAQSQQSFTAGQTDLKVVLPAEGKIRGVLKMPDGSAPPAGMTVQAMPHGNQSFIPLQAVIDKDGKFAIGSLQVGKVSFRLVTKDNQTPDWVIDAKPVKVKAGQTKEVTLPMVKGGTAEVSVFEEDVNSPIPKANIAIEPVMAADNNHYTSAVYALPILTNDNGQAVLRLIPGDYRIRAYARNYEPSGSNLPAAITVVEGQAEKMEFALKPVPSLKGLAKDEGGRPVAGADVAMTMMSMGPASSDADGKFSIRYRSQPPERNTVNSVVVRHAKLGLVGMADIEDPEMELAVTLTKGLTVKGVVTDTSGKPLKGAIISASTATTNNSMGLTTEEIITNDKGEYEIPALPKDMELAISATAEGYGRGKITVDSATKKDSVVTADNIVLPEAKLELSGRVEDEEGKPVANVRVYVSGNDQPSSEAAGTDKDGKFTFKGLAEGRVDVYVNDQRYSGNFNAQAGDTEVVIAAKRTVNSQESDDDTDDEDATSQPTTSTKPAGDF